MQCLYLTLWGVPRLTAGEFVWGESDMLHGYEDISGAPGVYFMITHTEIHCCWITIETHFVSIKVFGFWFIVNKYCIMVMLWNIICQWQMILFVILTKFMFSVSSSCIQQKPQFVNGAEKLVSYPYHMTLKTCIGHVHVWAIGPWAKSTSFQRCYFDMHFQYWCQNISTENSMVWHLMDIINDNLTSFRYQAIT